MARNVRSNTLLAILLAGQAIAGTHNLLVPDTIKQCDTVPLTISGPNPPYIITMFPMGTTNDSSPLSASPIQDIVNIGCNSVAWFVNLPVGMAISFAVVGQDGIGSFTDNKRVVQPGNCDVPLSTPRAGEFFQPTCTAVAPNKAAASATATKKSSSLSAFTSSTDAQPSSTQLTDKTLFIPAPVVTPTSAPTTSTLSTGSGSSEIEASQANMTTSTQNEKKPSQEVIAGIILGGLVGAALLVGTILFARRRNWFRARQWQVMRDDDEKQAYKREDGIGGIGKLFMRAKHRETVSSFGHGVGTGFSGNTDSSTHELPQPPNIASVGYPRSEITSVCPTCMDIRSERLSYATTRYSFCAIHDRSSAPGNQQPPAHMEPMPIIMDIRPPSSRYPRSSYAESLAGPESEVNFPVTPAIARGRNSKRSEGWV